MMTLNEFFKQQKIEYKKRLKKQKIMNSQEYKDTKLKDNLLENRLKDFEEDLLREKVKYSFDEEYKKMISLLRFVFPNIPQDRYTIRNSRILTDDEIQLYERLEECKKEKIICKIEEDAGKCERLLGYLLLIKASAKKSQIQEGVEEQIKKLFHSFSRNPLQYMPVEEIEETSNDDSVCKKRKTSANKRELLYQLYDSIFINRSDDGLDYEENLKITPYINENEKEIISFLLHIDPADENIMYLTKQRIISQLIEQDQSELDEIQKTENAIAKFNKIIDMVLGEELLEYAASLHDYFKCKKEVILSPFDFRKHSTRYYCEINQYGKESVLDELSSAEVDFINYLYQLYYDYCEKYEKSDQESAYDISNAENSRKWNILNEEERDTLAQYVWKLCDDNRTIFKYIREEDLIEERKKKYFLFGENSEEDQYFEEQGVSLGGWRIKETDINDTAEEAKEIIYSLVADIGNHPYYNTFKRAERIFQICKDAPCLIDLENPDMKKLYSKLEDQLKNADSICQKLIECYEKERAFLVEDKA